MGGSNLHYVINILGTQPKKGFDTWTAGCEQKGQYATKGLKLWKHTHTHQDFSEYTGKWKRKRQENISSKKGELMNWIMFISCNIPLAQLKSGESAFFFLRTLFSSGENVKFGRHFRNKSLNNKKLNQPSIYNWYRYHIEILVHPSHFTKQDSLFLHFLSSSISQKMFRLHPWHNSLSSIDSNICVGLDPIYLLCPSTKLLLASLNSSDIDVKCIW